MTAAAVVVAALAARLGAGRAVAGTPDTTPIACDNCADWNAPQAPFRIHGNAYYVGVRGLGAVLIVTSDGLILIDGALPQSVPLITANLRALGRRIQDVKWILVSHPHFDHAGGVAALARLSGAHVAASPRAALVLRAGIVQGDDPQAGFGEAMRFPPVPAVVEVADGAPIRLGDVSVTAHHTPGHAPGGTTWSWQSCERAQCLNVVYADSLNAVSAPGFRYGADGAQVQALRSSIGTVKGLPCDVLICPHPGVCRLFERRAARDRAAARNPMRNPMIDTNACRAYADAASVWLERRLGEERTGPAPIPDAGVPREQAR